MITDKYGNTFDPRAGYNENQNHKIYQVLLTNEDGSLQLDPDSGYPMCDSAATAALQAADPDGLPPIPAPTE